MLIRSKCWLGTWEVINIRVLNMFSNHYDILIMTTGEDGATIEGAIKIVKYAFCFEQWEVFEVLSDTVLTYLRVSYTYSLLIFS